jgi:DNA topoisomerase VI subunit B
MSSDEEKAKRIAAFLRLLAKNIKDHPETVKDIEIKEIPALSSTRKRSEFLEFDISKMLSEEGELAVRQKLEQMELRELRTIVRKNVLDPSKLAEKWKNKERLINLIIERMVSRKEKGQVFMNYP